MRNFAAMFAFFATGKYVANTQLQSELFGPVPRVEDAPRRLVGGRHGTANIFGMTGALASLK